MPRPHGGARLEGEVAGWRSAGICVVVSLLCAEELEELSLLHEETACRSSGIEYRSFPIQDRGVPRSAPSFFAMADELALAVRQGSAVAVHCRAGIGRSALTAGAVLLRLGVPVDNIFPVLSRARGFAIPDTPSQIEWFRSIAKQYEAC
nr:protein-tyrosine phosphatase family protein [Luteimonas sp. BDR2-5]